MKLSFSNNFHRLVVGFQWATTTRLLVEERNIVTAKQKLFGVKFLKGMV